MPCEQCGKPEGYFMHAVDHPINFQRVGVHPFVGNPN